MPKTPEKNPFSDVRKIAKRELAASRKEQSVDSQDCEKTKRIYDDMVRRVVKQLVSAQDWDTTMQDFTGPKGLHGDDTMFGWSLHFRDRQRNKQQNRYLFISIEYRRRVDSEWHTVSKSHNPYNNFSDNPKLSEILACAAFQVEIGNFDITPDKLGRPEITLDDPIVSDRDSDLTRQGLTNLLHDVTVKFYKASKAR